MAASPPQVKVTIHPNGTLELHHAAPGAKFQTYKGDLNATDGGPKLPANQLGFAAGKGYYKKPAPTAALPARSPVVAPAAPLTIQQQAQTILDPVSKSITDAINARVQAQQTAIGGYSKDLAGLMGQYAPASKQIYGEAQAGQAATDAALGQTLQGQGQSGQAELAANLAKISADPATAARINATSGANLASASGAMAAKGAASLSDLIARGASAQDYGAKQPGIAGLYGLQATKAAQSQATTDTANAVGTLEQQLPTVVQQLKGNQQAAALNKQQQASNETSRAVAATQLLGSAPPWAAKVLGIKPGASTQAAASAAQASADRQAAADARVAAATAAANTKAVATSAKVNTTLSKANGYLTNSSGEPILKGGTKQPYSGGSAPGAKAVSPTVRRTAAKDAEDLYHGTTKTDSKGNTVTVSHSSYYQDAVKTMMGRYGSTLGRKAVYALVNRWYPAGANFPGTTISNGRPAQKAPVVKSGGELGVSAQGG